MLEGGGELGVVRVQGGPGGVVVPPAPQQVDDLLAELLPRGAVQAEVHGVVDVHEQLHHRLGQLELHRLPQPVVPVLPEGGDDERDVHGQGGEQKGEGDGEQHDGELGALARAACPATSADLFGPRGGGARSEPRHLAMVVVVGGVLQPQAVLASLDDLHDDENVQDENDDERHEGVYAGVDPGPDLVNEVLMVRSRLAVGHVLAVHGPLHDLHGPQKVQVDGEHEQHEKTDHLLGAARVDHGGGSERETDHDVALHRDGDDQPDGQVTGRVSEGHGQLADPVRAVVKVRAGQFTQPQPEEADVEDQRVGHSQRGEVVVGGHLHHGPTPQDDEREDVAERPQHDNDGRHVQHQALQQPVLRELHQNRLVALHPHHDRFQSAANKVQNEKKKKDLYCTIKSFKVSLRGGKK